MYSIEFTFAKAYLQEIRANKQRQTDYILSQLLPHDEYAKQQGYVQALTDAETIFMDMMKRIFPEYGVN